MLLIEIQENIIKTQNSLKEFEDGIVYKIYKTFGGIGNFEQELRNIYAELISLRNSFISHTQAIIKISENKDMLMLIDSGYFDRFINTASMDSLIRIVSFNGFTIPETSLRVIAENRQVIDVLQAVNNEIKRYNDIITDFRQKRNKYFITLYRVPGGDELPNVITGTVNVEGMLPNAQAINNYLNHKSLIAHQENITIQSKKNEKNRINITKKDTSKKIIITKKK